MKDEIHTYIVQRNKYTTNKDGEAVQVGGDWYSCFTSCGEVKISKETIAKLVSSSLSSKEIEKACQKIDPTFKLSGSIILKRGTPFENASIYREDDGMGDDVLEDSEYRDELEELIKLSTEQSQALQETQEKIKKLAKRILK